MALTCDYRIMSSGSYKIGLNETLLVRISVYLSAVHNYYAD